MDKKDQEFNNLILKFDTFEEQFALDSNDPRLVEFLGGISQRAKGFNQTQLKEIHKRTKKLLDLFEGKKDEIKIKSEKLLTENKQMNQYLINSHYNS